MKIYNELELKKDGLLPEEVFFGKAAGLNNKFLWFSKSIFVMSKIFKKMNKRW
jgi:hypothetical protein